MTGNQRMLSLGEICDLQNGRAFKKIEWETQGLPIIRIQNLNNQNATFNYFQGDYDKKIEVNKGDLLFSWSGTVGSSFGPHLWDREKGVLNQHIFKISLCEKAEKRYMYRALQWITSEIEKQVNGAVGLVHITKTKLKKFEVPLPLLPEQKRIVAILDEAFAGIAEAVANAEKNLANARELLESYLNNVFKQKGDGWVETKLSKLMDISHGFAFKGPDFKASSNDSKPIVLTPGNYTKDGELYFTEKNTKRFTGDLPKDYLFEVGDLTIVMTDLSSKMKILGKPAFIDRPDILHNQRIGRVIFKESAIVPSLVYYYLRTRLVSERIKETSTGTMVRHTAPKRILALNILLPPTQMEQENIVSALDELSAETQRLETVYQQKLAALDELKQSILQKAFAGELTESIDTTKVIPFPKTIPNINITELHVGIIAMAYQMHEGDPEHIKTFCHVKAEKISHMVEAYAGINLGRNPVKDVAGPNDTPHLIRVEHRARLAGYFDFKENKSGKYSLKKKNRFNHAIDIAREALGKDYEAVDKILKIMLPMDKINKRQSEIFATVYAAWNNLLIRNEKVSDKAIVFEARENWHKNKLDIPEKRFFEAIKWMKKKNIIPKGNGRLVEKRPSDE